MSDDLEEFLAVLNRFGDDTWEDDEAFSWEAQRTWVTWWTFEDGEEDIPRRPPWRDIPRAPRRLGVGLTRVYVEKAGPQMRTHP